MSQVLRKLWKGDGYLGYIYKFFQDIFIVTECLKKIFKFKKNSFRNAINTKVSLIYFKEGKNKSIGSIQN